MQEQNVALSNLRDYELKLKRIESALPRIENGSFGECLDCGEEIALGRLEIMPEGIFCIHCASKKDKITTNLKTASKKEASTILNHLWFLTHIQNI